MQYDVTALPDFRSSREWFHRRQKKTLSPDCYPTLAGFGKGLPPTDVCPIFYAPIEWWRCVCGDCPVAARTCRLRPRFCDVLRDSGLGPENENGNGDKRWQQCSVSWFHDNGFTVLVSLCWFHCGTPGQNNDRKFRTGDSFSRQCSVQRSECQCNEAIVIWCKVSETSLVCRIMPNDVLTR